MKLTLSFGEQNLFIGSMVDVPAIGIMKQFFDMDGNPLREITTFGAVTKDKKTLLDVGASYGTFSLWFASSPDKVAHAVDGSFKTNLALKQTCVLNPERKIHQYRLMLGEADGIVKCLFDEHQALRVTEALKGHDRIGTAERMMTLDAFCEEYDIAPDVINIDVEGSELCVLDGAVKTLKKYRPVVFVDIHGTLIKNFYGRSPIDIYNHFVNLPNYKAFDLDMKEIPLSRYSIKLDNLGDVSERHIWIPQ